MVLSSIRPITGLNRTIAGMNSSLQNGLDYVNYNTSIYVGIEVYNTFIYLRIYVNMSFSYLSCSELICYQVQATYSLDKAQLFIYIGEFNRPITCNQCI